MFTIDNIQKWITLAGAVVAAIASSLNLWFKFSQNQDRIKVSFGPASSEEQIGCWLHVVSESTYPMHIEDYGFINKSGELYSLPYERSQYPPDFEELCGQGNCFLEKRGALFEIGGIELSGQIGAYATLVGKKHYTIDLNHSFPLYKRFWIKFKIWREPKYQ